VEPRPKGDASSIPPVAFYCVSSDLYFLGAVGLINSLRLVGHTEPIHVLDVGLTGPQRESLAPHATLLPAPTGREPFMVKAVAPLREPARVTVLLDADMIVTRPLTPLVERAAQGRVVGFAGGIDRFFPQWGDLLGLGPARRHAYLCSGLVCLGGSLGSEVLRDLDAARGVVEFERTVFGTAFENYPFDRTAAAPVVAQDYPFFFADQDLLNAILAARADVEHVIAIDDRLAPNAPFPRLRLADEATLECVYEDGAEPYVLHQSFAKPWLEPTRHGIYSRLLRRLLLGSDVAVRVSEGELPPWLRTGARAYVARTRATARDLFRWHVREPLLRRFRAAPPRG
jgi:hypothetical protein